MNLFRTLFHAMLGAAGVGIGQVSASGPLTLGSLAPVVVSALTSGYSATQDQPKNSLGAALHAGLGGGAVLITSILQGQKLRDGAILALYSGLSSLISANDPPTVKTAA